MKKTLLLSIGLLALILATACSNRNKNNPSGDDGQTTENISDEGVLTWELSANNQYWDKNEKDTYLYISVKIAGKEKKTEKKRVPLNIALVLDRSGSMEGDAMNYAKEAAKFVVRQLSSEDILSIVNYDDIVEVTSPSQLVKNKEVLIQKIDEIYARSSTNLSGGTLEGYKQVASTKKSNYVNRVLLLTDGLANEGIIDPAQLKKIASSKFQESGIALSTFGLGAEYDEDLLTQMAESGRGNYYYIDKADKIADIFAKELDGLLNVVAQSSTITIVLPPNTTCEKVYGYPFVEENGRVTIAFNDVFAKEDKVALLKIKLNGTSAENLDFPVELNFIDAETFDLNSVKKNLKIQATKDKALIKEHKNKKVEELIALFEATDTFDLILSDVDKNDYNAAKNKATSAIIRLKEIQKETPSEELQKQEYKMQEYLDNMDDMKEMEREEKLMLQKSTKNDNYSIKKMKKQ